MTRHSAGEDAIGDCCDSGDKPHSHDTPRIARAKLMDRLGEEFPLECPETGRDIRLVAFINEPGSIRKIMTHLVSGQFTPGSRTTLLTRPPSRSCSREYTPARSADKHLPEAHWRNPSILSPAVTATGTTKLRPSWCSDSWRLGLEKNTLAGDGLGGLERVISSRGDYGAVCHDGPGSEGENPGRTGGPLRSRGMKPRGVPHREIEEKRRRRERTSRRIEPVQY